jgi:hypothetical protein
MKYLKKFNEQAKSIEDWCVEFNIKSFKINKNNTVSSKEDVDLFKKQLEKIPIQFSIVDGTFDCGSNLLTSLKGSPKKVWKNFDCSYNFLTSLEYAPIKVWRNFDCNNNELLTLRGSPKVIGNYLHCGNNKLISLEGAPEEVGSIQCKYNKLISLKGLTKIYGKLYIDGNPIYGIYKLFNDYERYKASVDDYNYLRGTNIIRGRFIRACEDAEIDVPDSIPGYEYI